MILPRPASGANARSVSKERFDDFSDTCGRWIADRNLAAKDQTYRLRLIDDLLPIGNGVNWKLKEALESIIEKDVGLCCSRDAA